MSCIAPTKVILAGASVGGIIALGIDSALGGNGRSITLRAHVRGVFLSASWSCRERGAQHHGDRSSKTI